MLQIFHILFSCCGFVFLVSVAAYLLPQLAILFAKETNFVKRYGRSWAFITGGSSGIGLSLAKKLGRQGMNLIILSETEQNLKNAKAILNNLFPTIQVCLICADLSKDPNILAKTVLNQIDGLDISAIVVNAGYGLFESASNPSASTLHMFHSNIVGHQHLINALFPILAKRRPHFDGRKWRRGCVIFTSSVTGCFVSPYNAVYSATKAYLDHFGECLSLEASCLKIDVVSIRPGSVKTKFHDRIPRFFVMDLINLFQQSPDAVASRVLKSVGMFVKVDCGVFAVLVELMNKL
eukprot:MONOS_8112.1-p1 / transcript=MONOS_8112.1 / gene=MONOS_8112 / organism=Monocercomonoides_exilis_PA203 / gene_product=short chain dehydrogenase / transcript_product=short chain dehydrogenase / location=Mono_scaffold00297:91-1355(-) / protein_length=292 / sequence_SO=supercontig / SO=protein_coding / is_pseudo=false